MTNTEPRVYVLTMFAVYDHGCAGVFTTVEAAREHALHLDAQSDWYHDWRIDELPLDVPLTTEPLTAFWKKAADRGRPEAIEFVPWKGADQ